MKFSGYNSNAQLHVNAPHVVAPSNPLAYGAGGAGWSAAGKMLGQVGAAVEAKQKENDTQDLLDARNKIMTSLTQQMYNSEDGFMTTGYGENAKGLADRVTQAVKDTTDNVLQNYNGRVQQAVRKNISDNVQNFQRIAASRESNEGTKLKAARFDEGLKNGSQLCGLNYNNDEMINNQLQSSLQLTQAMGVSLGMTGEQVAGKQRGVYTDCISNAVNSALTAEDYPRARQLLDQYKTQMDITAWNKLDNAVNKQQEKIDTYNTAKAIYEQSGGDPYDAMAMAEQACTKENGFFDVDRYDKMMARINSLASIDKKAERQATRAARQQAVYEMEAMPTPEAAQDYYEEHKDELGEDGAYWLGLVNDLAGRKVEGYSRGYKDKNAVADIRKLKEFKLTLQDDGKMTPKKWVDIEYAAENLVDNGRISAEALEDLNNYGADPDIQGKLTDMIQKEGTSAGYRYLLQVDCDADAAAIMVARASDIYKTRLTDEGSGEDESEE